MGESILSLEPSAFSDHLTTTIVDFLPLDLGCSLFLPLEPNLQSVYTLAYPLQRRNREQIDSLLETTTFPNLVQAAPDLGIHLTLGVVALTTS